MLMNIANQSVLDAARIGFHTAFLEQLGLVDDNPLMKLFNEVSSSTGIEEWDWLGDVPDFEEWKQDRFLADLDAYKLRILNKDWASGIRVHQNQIKDDKLGLIAPKIAELARKARTHKVRLMVKLLLNGFTGTAFADVGNGLAYDGNFFFSTSRTSGSNKVVTPLTSQALMDAEVLLESQANYTGDEGLQLMGSMLIVGPKLLPIAQKLMTQDYLPSAAGTATESNYLKGRYQVAVSPLLRGAYQNYWFLVDANEPVKPFIFQNREDVSTSAVLGAQGTTGDSVPRFQRGELWFGAEARYNVGYFEPRLVVGAAVP